MALEKSYEMANGYVATSAYHKIDNVSIVFKKEEQFINVQVKVWKDSSAKTSGKDTIDFRNYIMPVVDMDGGLFDASLLDDDNLLKKAYVYLKTLDSYTGAVDV